MMIPKAAARFCFVMRTNAGGLEKPCTLSPTQTKPMLMLPFGCASARASALSANELRDFIVFDIDSKSPDILDAEPVILSSVLFS